MKNLEGKFVPYQESLRLKRLGFNESCWCYFMNGVFNPSLFLKDYDYFKEMNREGVEYILTPLWQDAFDWFYWEHHIKVEPLNFIGDKCTYRIHNGDYNTPIFHIPEEARIACLRKLLEIVEQQKKTHE